MSGRLSGPAIAALALGVAGLAAGLWVLGPGTGNAPSSAPIVAALPAGPPPPEPMPDLTPSPASPPDQDAVAPARPEPAPAEPAHPEPATAEPAIAAPPAAAPGTPEAPEPAAVDAPAPEAQQAAGAAQRGPEPAPPVTPSPASAEPAPPPPTDMAADPPAAAASVPPEAAPTMATALPPAPDPALIEVTADGPLPTVGSDGRQPWRVYAHPFADLSARPRVAIVVSGLGLRASTTEAAIDTLPPAVSLGFNPYARDLDGWAARARAAGHEILMQLPMEPLDYPNSDPGPKALLTTLDPRDNQARLDWTLGRATGYVGVMTYMGSRFSGQDGPMAPVLDSLKARGLMILDSRTTAHSVIPVLAAAKGVPVAAATRLIDTNPSRHAVRDRLAELERYARANGAAIGIASDYPATLAELTDWLGGLEGRGLVLAPLSALADTRLAAPPPQETPAKPPFSVAPGKQG